MKKKSLAQGEIFGIALVFVILIVGILIYSQIQAFQPDLEETTRQDSRYSILADDTVDSLRQISTGCQIERTRDSLELLLRYCYEQSAAVSSDPGIRCNDNYKKSCSYAKQLINDSLHKYYHNQTEKSIIGPIPFYFRITSPTFEHEIIHNLTLTNFGSFENLDENTFRRSGYRRISAGPQIVTAGSRSMEIEFYLFVR